MKKLVASPLASAALAAGLALGLVAPALVTPALAAKDSLTLAMPLEPPHLDPTAGAAAAIDEVVYANIFEGLTRIDSSGAVKPALAESWTVSGDGLTYTFKLQSGVTFHDGSGFDSADVKFSFDRAMAEDSVNAQKGLFDSIAAVEVPDAGTVVVTLKQPAGNLLFNLGWGDAVIVAPETAAENKNNPVGTGPFVFGRWVKGDRVEMVRNENYWGEPAKLAKATIKIIPDPAAATAAMLAGDIDAYANFPAPEAMAQFEADPRFKVVIGSTEGETILAINNTRGPLSDIRVRRALAHAVDRQAVIDGAMFGYGTPIGTHFAPHHPAYVDLTGSYPYDPEKAKALLAEAGHGDGLTLSLKLPPPSYARRGGEIIAAQLAQVGVEAKISQVEWPGWLEQVFKGTDYDLTIVSHTEPMDIGIYGRDTYYFNYQDADFKALMTKLNTTVDETARYGLLGDAQKKLSADSVNVFLFQLAKHGVWNKDVVGLWENSPVQANDLTAVYWN
ncbi:ABC transporter substrate-binding protein [Pelagibius litoralis]|uniref:ABC transporter substrate-binding protein n=1 Tax=Pelagibius litoralis TaxID=374515 RepID=A0A967EX93_9PROT|nr:ABC transporter substrate-binding protein [Pelagibius litoralis]NIA68360.1 ABC transporter substrate-binding protein [Pelagibius litoralis]